MDNEKTARRIEQICLEGGAELKRLRQILNRVGAAYHQSGDWHNYIERRGLENASLAEKEAAIAASERGIEAMHELWAFLAEPRVGGRWSLMSACVASKANGEHCRGLVATGSDYCPAHEPRRQEARRRAASKAARSKGKGGLDELYGQARRLYDEVQQGTIDPKVGTVLVQAVNVQTRILELQRRIELANVLTPEQVEYETKTLLDIMRRNIKDKEVLSAISNEMSALVGEDY